MSAINQSGQSLRNPKGLALLVFFCGIVLNACSAPNNSGINQQSYTGVTVVGVTSKPGVEVAINRHALAREFAELLAQRRQFQVYPAGLLRETVGSSRVDEILNRYARRGQLAQRDLQFLMAAGLTARYAVIARVESDEVKKMPERREAMVGNNGSLLMDRQRVVLASQRSTRVSAVLFDLRTGKSIWNKHYQVDPVTEVASTIYHGNSFSGSLAAAFANTVVNGVSVARQPVAPPLKDSLSSLLAEISRQLPVR
ncbi:MAG: hypothetical protein AB8B79_18535 [Granulosicoccus sp.]